MKKLFTVLSLFILVSSNSFAQKIEKDLEPFNKILIGPGVNLELIRSDHEKIHIVSESELVHDLTIAVDRGELKVYFDYKNFDFTDDNNFANGKYTLENTPYEGIRIYAKLYFRDLEELDFRGDQKLFCKDEIRNEEFEMKIYGECEVKLSAINVINGAIKSYGENEIEVLGGNSENLKIISYGESEIKVQGVRCEDIKLTSFGESEIEVFAENILKVKVIGEGEIRYKGDPEVKEFNLGEAHVYRID